MDFIPSTICDLESIDIVLLFRNILYSSEQEDVAFVNDHRMSSSSLY